MADLKEKIRLLLFINESPHRIALTFSIGLFIGISPFIGAHTILALLVAFIFRLNKIIILLGTYVTNPWTIIPIYTFSTFIGAKILGIKSVIPDIDWTDITFLKIMNGMKPLVIPFFVGTTFVGAISSIIIYFILYALIKKTRRLHNHTRMS